MKQTSPNWKILLVCFLRTYLVGAAFNTRGMQNVGLVFALEPGLKAIYPDPGERARARKRYLSHYNTHMFWTPLLTAVFLSIEDKIARGLFPASVLNSVKNTTIYTLSAIGDSLFAGSLLVFWSLSTACLVIYGLPWLALAWGGAWFVSLHLFKVATFVMGFKEGLKVLVRLRKWGLINWSRRLKYLNALLVVWLLYGLWPQSMAWEHWLVALGFLLVGAWLVSRTFVSREAAAVLLGAAYLGLPWIMKSLGKIANFF